MATHSTHDEMKSFVQQHFEDFVNNKRVEMIRQNMTPDFYDHDGPGERPTGVEDDENMMRAMYERMPGMRITIEEMIAEGDRVVCRNIWRWNDAASGVPMEFHGFVEWRFEGSKFAERWATVTNPRQASSSAAT